MEQKENTRSKLFIDWDGLYEASLAEVLVQKGWDFGEKKLFEGNLQKWPMMDIFYNFEYDFSKRQISGL